MCPLALPSPRTRTLSASPWARPPPPLPRPPQAVATASPAPSAQQNGSYPIILCTYKKDNQIFLIHEEIQNGAVAKLFMTRPPHIWGYISAFPHILGSPITLQLLHSEFPYIWGKFDFLFYQCVLSYPKHWLGSGSYQVEFKKFFRLARFGCRTVSDRYDIKGCHFRKCYIKKVVQVVNNDYNLD